MAPKSTHIGASIVFDSEPLIAFMEDEPGSDQVEEYLNKIENDELTAAISPIQETEIRYVAERMGDEQSASRFLQSLRRNGLKRVPAEKVIGRAAEYKAGGHSLGDSFALGTAHYEMATLVVGADSDFDISVSNEPFEIERIRHQPV